MAKRIDFSKSNQDRKKLIRGAETIDGPGTAEQARRSDRNTVNERKKKSSLERAAHGRIAKQARTDYEKNKAASWPVIRGPKK
jgi:hypothetical protein